MSEMVERVARAIVTAMLGDDRGWEGFTDEARAAIVAMRELPADILRAGQDEIAFHVPDRDGPCRIHPNASAEAWNSMLDKVLE